MHGVNLDLLRATATHHPDGTAKDPHARHRAELLALQRAARRLVWQQRLDWLRTLLRRPATKPAPLCIDP